MGLVLLLASFSVLPTLAQRPASVACCVKTSASGRIAAFFVADGDYVQRGQLLVKLESRTGSAVYVSAPMAGRIQFVRPTPGGDLVANTQLALIQAPIPATRLTHRH